MEGQTITLAEAGIQAIQLELIRRASFNEFDGDRVSDDLLRHRGLWRAVVMEHSFPLAKLRDMAGDDPMWNVDTLYILAVDELSANQLAGIAGSWQADLVELVEPEETDELMGIRGTTGRILVRVWWD